MNKEGRYLLHPQKSHQKGYGLHPVEDSRKNSEPSDYDDSDDEDDEVAKENLLRREEKFTICYDVQKGYRGTELKFFSFGRPREYNISKKLPAI